MEGISCFTPRPWITNRGHTRSLTLTPVSRTRRRMASPRRRRLSLSCGNSGILSRPAFLEISLDCCYQTGDGVLCGHNVRLEPHLAGSRRSHRTDAGDNSPAQETYVAID